MSSLNSVDFCLDSGVHFTYNDYTLFGQWTDNGIFFVTRQKENAVYEIVDQREIPKYRQILADQIIRLTGQNAEEKCPHLL